MLNNQDGYRKDIAERQSERNKQYSRRPRQSRNYGRRRVNNRTISTLERTLNQKTANLDENYEMLAQIDDPLVKRLINQIAKDERNHEMKLAKVLDFYERNPEAGGLSKLLQQLSLMIGSNKGKGFTTGIITTLIALALLPKAQKALKPLLLAVLKGVNDVSEKAGDALSVLQESVEDVVAEAKFDKMADKIDIETGNFTMDDPL